jgi:putative acetyltransferase
MPLTFHPDDLGKADVEALLELHFEQMLSISPKDACHVLSSFDLRDPAVTFWSAREEGALMGVGALRELGPAEGEVKSMRTAPYALGRGIGRAILHHIIREARSRRYLHLRLETGSSEAFAAALRLYESEGFVACGPFGGYCGTPFTRFYAREL